jgi:hypothetical protein
MVIAIVVVMFFLLSCVGLVVMAPRARFGHVVRPRAPERNFYDLMGDLWTSPEGKPIYGPSGWVASIRLDPLSRMAPSAALAHLVDDHQIGPDDGGEDPVMQARQMVAQHQRYHDFYVEGLHRHY